MNLFVPTNGHLQAVYLLLQKFAEEDRQAFFLPCLVAAGKIEKVCCFRHDLITKVQIEMHIHIDIFMLQVLIYKEEKTLFFQAMNKMNGGNSYFFTLLKLE